MSCQLLKVKTCLKRLNKMLPWETELISLDNNTILMSKCGCHTLLHLAQLKIVILLGCSQKIPKEGMKGIGATEQAFPSHSPVEQQGPLRENNSFFSLFKHIFHCFPQKHPGLTRGISCHIFVISNGRKCQLH